MIAIDDYVIDVLMRDLVGHDRRVVSFLVYLWFTSEQGKSSEKDMSLRPAIGRLPSASECRRARRRQRSAG
jgi:hypothetical protein